MNNFKYMTRKRASILLVALASTATMAPVHAGGLFGDGGLIRGWVGDQLDPIEREITTPMARRTVEGLGTAAGGVLGANVGIPTVGAVAGNCFGRAVNSAFAGRGASGCGGRGFRVETSPRTTMGNRCATPWGVSDPGPRNPIGTVCFVGPDRGRVVR